MPEAIITQSRERQKELAKFLYEHCFTQAEIADIIGKTRHTVNKWVKINRWRKQRKSKYRQEILIAFAYKKAGFTNAAIVKKMHRTKQTVSHWFNQYIITGKGIVKLSAKVIKAKRLIIDKGYNQKEAAKEIGVSENTMRRWGKKYAWTYKKGKKRNDEMKNKIAEAKRLIVDKGYTQKEAAKEIGVSQNTITAWKKEFNWK